jgi:hypothetical protein
MIAKIKSDFESGQVSKQTKHREMLIRQFDTPNLSILKFRGLKENNESEKRQICKAGEIRSGGILAANCGK